MRPKIDSNNLDVRHPEWRVLTGLVTEFASYWEDVQTKNLMSVERV